MIPNWNISTSSKGPSSLSGSEAETSEERNGSTKLINALLIDSDRVQKLPQLAFWFICLYLGSKSAFPESWIYSHHTSHHDSWKLSCQSSTTFGKQSSALLLLYLEPIKVLKGTTCCSNCTLRICKELEHSSTMLPWIAAAGDSVLPSPTAGKPPKHRHSEVT